METFKSWELQVIQSKIYGIRGQQAKLDFEYTVA